MSFSKIQGRFKPTQPTSAHEPKSSEKVHCNSKFTRRFVLKIWFIYIDLGRFEVESSKLEQVDVVEESDSMYRHEKYILKWTLKKHNNRKLYLLCENGDELKSWINLFKDYKQVRVNF